MLDLGSYQNPRHCSCLLDEDLLGKIKRLSSHSHPKTMSVRVLQHYSVMAALTWCGLDWISR